MPKNPPLRFPPRASSQANPKVSATAHKVSISITDYGTGIDVKEQHKLFQPFARMTRHHPNRCGYGLGLAIAHQTVQAMGGRLEVESLGLDRGTTARVILPVASPHNSDQPVDWDSITELPGDERGPNTIQNDPSVTVA